MSSQGGREGGQKLPIILSKKTTKRREGVKIVYGRPLILCKGIHLKIPER